MRESKLQNFTDWRERLVGIEFENPVAETDATPASFETMQEVWKSFGADGWRTNTDHYYQVFSGAEKDFGGKTVPLISDNGAGNLEMALPPLSSITEGKNLLSEVRADILKVLSRNKLRLLGLGMQPGPLPMPIEERRVKSFLYKGFDSLGPTHRLTNSIMAVCSAHQAGVSIRIHEVIPAANALVQAAGLIIALCANSPIQNWSVLPWKEWRIAAWYFRFMGEKSGFGKLARFPEQPFSSLAHYLMYYWNTPYMILPPMHNEDFLFPKPRMNYLAYFSAPRVTVANLAGKTKKHVPSPADINFAVLCMWPFAKPHIIVDPAKVTVADFMKNLKKDGLEEYLSDKLLNCYIEYRATATAPIGEEMAIPALILGLVNNLPALTHLTERYSWSDWGTLVYAAAARGMEATIRKESIIPLLTALISIAEAGLNKRPFKEALYLSPLKERVAARKTPADNAIEKFKKGKKEFLDYITYSPAP